jgi:hypothetical protein
VIRPCSALLDGKRICERAGQCANYSPWYLDPRSVFNACAPIAKPFFHFIPIKPVAEKVDDLALGESLPLFA